MILDAQYKLDHCRAELTRGHVFRMPISWLITARALARKKGCTDLVEAFTIAIDVHRSGDNRNPRLREMRKLAGRKLA